MHRQGKADLSTGADTQSLPIHKGGKVSGLGWRWRPAGGKEECRGPAAVASPRLFRLYPFIHVSIFQVDFVVASDKRRTKHFPENTAS